MAKMWKCFDGTVHPVSNAFVARVPADLNGLSLNLIIGERDYLMALASGDLLTRAKLSLGDDELKRLDALIDVLNLNRALKWLQGRDYRTVFGAGATLDQVHGNLRDMSCGCTLQVVFDHNRRTETDNETFPHYPVRICARHRHLGNDFIAHFAAVTEDCAKADNKQQE